MGRALMQGGLWLGPAPVKRMTKPIDANLAGIQHGAMGETTMIDPAKAAQIAFDDFLKVDIRVGTILSAENFAQARKPALKLTIDFGVLGVKKSSAQITRHYDAQALVGRQVAAVVNFPPRQIGPFMSEVLTLGFPDADGEVILVAPTLPAPNGGRLF